MDLLIGNMYVLSNLSLMDERVPFVMFLKGGEYPLVRRSVNEFEWTEVLEVM